MKLQFKKTKEERNETERRTRKQIETEVVLVEWTKVLAFLILFFLWLLITSELIVFVIE